MAAVNRIERAAENADAPSRSFLGRVSVQILDASPRGVGVGERPPRLIALALCAQSASRPLRAARACLRRSRRDARRTAVRARPRGARARRRAPGRRPRRSCWRRRSAAWRRASASNSCELARTTSRSFDRIAPARARDVDQVHEHLRAFEVAQELVAEAVASCAPSISPGTSATTKLRSPLERDDAEIRRERGERVVGDLRPRGRDARDQRGLAGVREADQADVGEQLQLEPEVLLFAGLAGLRPARRAVGGRREARVAAAAAAALRDQHALAFVGEIGEQRVRLVRSPVFS